ncbi:uncharacterized protein LOC144195314 isoform X2 [Stigmatopora nigra]
MNSISSSPWECAGLQHHHANQLSTCTWCAKWLKPWMAFLSPSVEFSNRMPVHPPQKLGSLFLVTLFSMVVSSWLGLEEVFFSPGDQRVKEGEEASFHCISGESSSPAMIIWIKDGSLVTSGIQTQGEYGGGWQKKTSGTLRLVNVSLADDGIYICQTINLLLNISRRSRPAKLTVLAAPLVTLWPRALTVALGDRASLQCEASGEPPPSISWLKKGLSKQTGAKLISGWRNATLIIESTRSYDQGVYMCDASNALGHSQATVTLTVTVSPVIVSELVKVTRELGESAVLPCVAVGVLPIHYTWTRDRDARNPVVNFEGKHVDEDGSLHFPSVQESDAGEYFCMAENRAGRQRRRSLLLVTGCSSSSHCGTTSKPRHKMTATSPSTAPAQDSPTQIHPLMLPSPPFHDLLMELSPSFGDQMDNVPSSEAYTDASLSQTTESPLVQLQSSLQRPSSFRKHPPTPEPFAVQGLNVSIPERASEAGDEQGRNTLQSPEPGNNTRYNVTPEPPLWLPILEKHDVPIVKNQPIATGRSAQRKLGVPMRHTERQATGRPYENRGFEDDECTDIAEYNAHLSDTLARPPGLSLVTVQMEPTSEEPHSVTVETYPEPLIDTKVDDGEVQKEEQKSSTPATPSSFQLSEEECPRTAADNRSLCRESFPSLSSSPRYPDTGLQSSLTLRGAEALAAPIRHSLSVSHGGTPVSISHHVSVGRASVAVNIHFYPAVDPSTLDNEQENG